MNTFSIRRPAVISSFVRAIGKVRCSSAYTERLCMNGYSVYGLGL